MHIWSQAGAVIIRAFYTPPGLDRTGRNWGLCGEKERARRRSLEFFITTYIHERLIVITKSRLLTKQPRTEEPCNAV